MNRQQAEQRGRQGEWVAEIWLRLHGWRVLGRRIKTKAGEVDLIARKKDVLAFIEVKTRAKAVDLNHAIDEYRLRRVVAAAQYLLPRYTKPNDGVRIDVILIAPWQRPQHIEDVWRG
jgi:putative endonuclease